MRVAFIGNSLPRRCGIATFTTDLQQAIAVLPNVAGTAIVAMRNQGAVFSYPAVVQATIEEDDRRQYSTTAAFINEGGFDIACLQHEFGIFGGPAGSYVLDLISALRVPLVTTLHTVLDQPSIEQRAVMDGILAASSRLIVMAEKARHILIDAYAVDAAKIVVIPHGIPDYPFVRSASAKEKLGFSGREIILTFGLISPNKGIETMIDAMPAVIERSPGALYLVMGATHPTLIREDGEAYRQSLMDRVARRGLGGHVAFLDEFVERPTLLEYISMCDVYVTPYLNEAQMTSGTLAYSHGLGRPIVSTPYWHATELLADGTGMLVPFSDPDALGRAVAALLNDEPMRLAMGLKAYEASRPMIWANTADRYQDCFRTAWRAHGRRPINERLHASAANALPPMALRHFIGMCDDTGLFQHAVHKVPDRNHGYCVDDNARALLLCRAQFGDTHAPIPTGMALRFAAFIQHAWNPDCERFRNFMGYDRRWLEPTGSEDSHGRTLWALGACTRHDGDRAQATWAAGLFRTALPSVAGFTSPRAWAFTLLGLDDYCAVIPDDREACAMRDRLARLLEDQLATTATLHWDWFEAGLAYDNARLCEALIRTGAATGRSCQVDTGLRTLSWLVARQTAPSGHFRPVGTETFGTIGDPLLPFDQQPVEAAATIAACLAAYRVKPAPNWPAEAQRAFDWFLGSNDLATALVDIATGSCRDGLHPDRANENCGAESVLSYLLALADMQQILTIEASRADRLPLPACWASPSPIKALSIK